MATIATAQSYTLTQLRALELVRDNPGKIEKRRDFDGAEYYWLDGHRANALKARALDALLSKGDIRVARRDIHTVGLTAPREAWVLYTAE